MEPISAKEVMSRCVTVIHRVPNEVLYVFEDDRTDRMFEIRRRSLSEGPRFNLTEFIPDGTMAGSSGLKDGLPDHAHVALIKGFIAEHGPNGFFSKLAGAGLDGTSLIRFGAHATDGFQFDSMDECAERVAAALNTNTWYRSHASPSTAPDSPSDVQNYFVARKNRFDWSMEHEQGIFRGCTSDSARALHSDIKKDILAYLNAPSQTMWLTVRGHVITGQSTLWDAWCHDDFAAPREGCTGFPEAEPLRRAIRREVQRESEWLEQKMKAASVASHAPHLSVVRTPRI